LSSVNVPLHIALLGGKINIPTIDGEVELTVPAGVQPGEKRVLRGKGVPKLKRTGSGDHWITFSISIPKSLTQEQKDLINKAFNLSSASAKKGEPKNTQEQDPTTSDTTDKKKPGFFESAINKIKENFDDKCRQQ
jgi:molecular chaperone DnaJ